MKHTRLVAALALAIGLCTGTPAAAGTPSQLPDFTYQGRLDDNGQPAEGTYDLAFSLWDSETGGSQIGDTIDEPDFPVTRGVFTVSLAFPGAFIGDQRFLEVTINGVALPRQPISTAPVAQFALDGNPGPAGPTGAIGPQGDPGVVGPQGEAGATGPQGPIGPQGIAGEIGPVGPQGIQGLQGEIGAQGPQGTQGDIGPQGVQGNQGLQGDPGAAGPEGPAGLQGPEGASGPAGPEGPAGPQGPQGASGPAGPQGPIGPGTIAGTGNYIGKFTGVGPSTTMSNSLLQDNGTGVGIGAAPSALSQLYVARQQFTVNGDGQHSLFGYRTRDSQNDGTGYAFGANNTATTGYNFWGDVYSFGVGGWSYNDYTRTGGVLGADQNGSYWGSLGYRSSGFLNYGVYGSAAYASGAGRGGEPDSQGIGGGFYGGMIGSWSHGEVMGAVSSGSMFASYNVGNVYTSGFSADLIPMASRGDGERAPAYAVTSPELKVYDNGSGTLTQLREFVPFSQAYVDMLGEAPVVTVSAIGSPAQLYIDSIARDGFTVVVASDPSGARPGGNLRFNWIAVGKRMDAGLQRALPSDVLRGDFDEQLRGVMSNDADTAVSGRPIWWDGETVRFDAAPEVVRPAKREPK